jgi:hypothetical protein
MISEKKKTYLPVSGRAHLPDPLCPGPAAEARQGPSGPGRKARGRGLLSRRRRRPGVHAPQPRGPRLFKLGQSPTPRALPHLQALRRRAAGARCHVPPALPPSGSPPRDASGAGCCRKEVHTAKMQLHRQPPSRVNPCSAAARVRPESAASTAGRPFGFRPRPSASAAGEHPHVVPHTSSTPCAPCLSPSSPEPPAIWPPWPPVSPVLSWSEGRRS